MILLIHKEKKTKKYKESHAALNKSNKIRANIQKA